MKNRHVLLIILGVVILILLGWLVLRFPYVLDSSDSKANLIWYLVILCAAVPSLSYLFSRLGMGQALKYAAVWAGIFITLLVGYSLKDELSMVGHKVRRNLFPFVPAQTENGHTSFTRSLDGHFYIEALVDHTPIRFMLDTGATTTTLTLQDAKRLGYNVNSLSYDKPVQTANGTDFVATVRITEIKLGDLTLNDISATVSKNLSEHSLLGMNFLKRLKGFNIEGDQLMFKFD